MPKVGPLALGLGLVAPELGEAGVAHTSPPLAGGGDGAALAIPHCLAAPWLLLAPLVAGVAGGPQPTIGKID